MGAALVANLGVIQGMKGRKHTGRVWPVAGKPGRVRQMAKTTQSADERKNKVERAAEDFATRFEGVMRDLANG